MRFYPVFLLFLFAQLATPLFSAAQAGNQTLLWRITGKGLHQPSYVFGTLHLNDKRLFRFDDSVYAAVESTKGFANEVDMNEIAAYYINKALDEVQDEKKLSDVLTEQQMKDMEKPLMKKFNKNIKDITTRDIIKEKNKWMSDVFSKGEMPTFVDAYLYDLTRRQGKWLGGIEDVQDQTSMIDRSDITFAAAGEEPVTLEKMIGLYTSQDINGIDKVINGYDSLSKDVILTRRNVKMARRMDSLSALRPMFFAVGAAHLPGDSGVISLLRARGFTVEPVFSHKKIFSGDYKFTEVPAQWVDVSDENKLYQVSMPGNPASVKLYGLIEMKFMLEFSNLSGYCTMAIVAPGSSGNSDSVYNELATRIFKRKNIKAPKKIKNGDMTGVEYTDEVESYNMRMQLFHTGSITYMAVIYGAKLAYLKTPEAERFFASLKLTPHTSDGGHSYAFADTVMGITFTAPVKLEMNPQMMKQSGEPEGWDVRMYTAQDLSSGAFFLLISKQAKAGHFVNSDSEVLAAVSSKIGERYDATETKGVLDGYPMVKLDGSSEGLHLKMMSIARGNKNVSVMLLTKSDTDDENLLQVFTSFRTFPYQRAVWRQSYDPAHTFSSISPAPFRQKTLNETNKRARRCYYYSFDTLAAANYNVYADTLGSYEWAASDTAFLHAKVRAYAADNDSALYEKETQNGADKGIETVIREGHSSSYERIRALVHGKLVYYLSTAGELGVIAGPDADQFFSGFTALTPVTFNLLENKCEKLINALKSSDSAERNGAYKAISNIPFGKADLPVLHRALLAPYPRLNKYDDGTWINERLALATGTIGDVSSVAYAHDHYTQLAGEQEKLKYALLEMLAKIETAESYSTIADMITQSPPRNDKPYRFERLMEDSLPLLKTIMPSLLKVAADSSVGVMIAGFAIALKDSGLISNTYLLPYAQNLVTLSGSLLHSYENDSAYDNDVYGMLSLLADLNTPAALGAVQKYLAVKGHYFRTKVALLLMSKDYSVAPAVLESIAADAGTRSILYNGLKKIKKEALFPKKYLAQKYFAEADMYDKAGDMDDWPSVTVKFLSEKTAIVKGVARRFYLYRVVYTDGTDTAVYLGVAGAYDAARKLLVPAKKMSGVYMEERFGELEADDQFHTYLRSFEDRGYEE